MKYRRLDESGDFVMGHGDADYLENSPECAAQAVVTRLRLLAGEWFLDLVEGTPYQDRVWGKQTKASYDPILRARILGTEGVRALVEYASAFDPETRKLTVSATIDTVYGTARIESVLTLAFYKSQS